MHCKDDTVQSRSLGLRLGKIMVEDEDQKIESSEGIALTAQSVKTE